MHLIRIVFFENQFVHFKKSGVNDTMLLRLYKAFVLKIFPYSGPAMYSLVRQRKRNIIKS